MHFNEKEILAIYKKIKIYHNKYLKSYGVKLPKLKNNNDYTKNALTLIYLTHNYPNTKVVSKKELTKFIRNYYPDVNDVQQARHLSAQKGWYIIAGSRDDIVKQLSKGEYQLYTLKQPYLGFKSNRRLEDIGDDWDKIKKEYQNRCATCGSEENKPHFHWRATKTILQKAHMNPQKPLIAGNIVPQCQKCNRGDRNRWVYDEKGRVVQLANAKVILSCSEQVQREAYRLLHKKFKN